MSSDRLADLERRAWRSTFDDGLFDLLLGSMLVLNWLASVVPNDRLLYPFFIALVGGYVIVKRYVVLPRAGLARFGAPRRQRKAWSVAVLFASALLGLVMMLLVSSGGAAAAWLRTHPIVFEAGFPLLVVAVFSALASLLDVTRIHAIGVVMALAFGTQLWFDRAIGFLVGGAVVCIPGLVLLLRFLRRHPPLTAEERHHVR